MAGKFIKYKSFGIVLVSFYLITASALAAPWIEEMPLNPLGEAYEVNQDPQGLLWISDAEAGEVWRLDPVSGAYTVFAAGGGPSDARSDGLGTVWWADYAANKLVRMTAATSQVQAWKLRGDPSLYTTAIDTQGHVWVTDFLLPYLYVLNPVTNDLCTYTLPGNGAGSYMAVSGQYLWLGENANGRILRLDTTSDSFTYWQLPYGSYPLGLALDELGRVWWADAQQSLAGRLDPVLSKITKFSLPNYESPQMIALKGSQALLSLQNPGGVGILDPLTASSALANAPKTELPPTAPDCVRINPTSSTISSTNGTATWSGQSYNITYNQTGWIIFASPTGGLPYGVAAASELFAVDQGRQVLAKISLAVPLLQVEKLASVSSVPETGAEVTFTFRVLNSSNETTVTITSLQDSVFGTLEGDGDCEVGTVLAAGESCEFSLAHWVEGDFSGPSHTNTFTAHAEDASHNDSSDTASVTINFSNVAPTLLVTKIANLTTIPETGADVTFTYTVQNTSAKESITIKSLVDDVFGALSGDADCKTNTVLLAGAACQFSITRQVKGDFSGPDHVNVFTAVAKDNDNTEATSSDNAVVDFSDSIPTILAGKMAAPTSVPETGGNVTFTFRVTANSGEALTIQSLADNLYGALTGDADCKVGTVIQGGASCEFDITRWIAGDFGGPAHSNLFTVTAKDNENHTASDEDDAAVNFTNILPAVSLAKAANPTSVPETGGEVTFTYTLMNQEAEAVEITTLNDDKFSPLEGDADCHVGSILAASTGICSFQATFSVPPGDYPGGHTNKFTSTVADDDGFTTTAEVSRTVIYTDVLPDITVAKSANPASLPETGGQVNFTYTVTNHSPEAATITALSDNEFGALVGDGDCHVDTVLPGSGGSCSFEAAFTVPLGDYPGSHTNTFTATVTDGDGNNDTASDSETVTYTDVKPEITVTKTSGQSTIPESGGNVTFTFVITNHSLEPATITALNDDKFGPLDGDADCHVGAVIPGGGSCTFQALLHIPPGTAPGSHTNTFTATVSDGDGNSASASDSETVTYTAGPVLHYVYLPMVRR